MSITGIYDHVYLVLALAGLLGSFVVGLLQGGRGRGWLSDGPGRRAP